MAEQKTKKKQKSRAATIMERKAAAEGHPQETEATGEQSNGAPEPETQKAESSKTPTETPLDANKSKSEADSPTALPEDPDEDSSNEAGQEPSPVIEAERAASESAKDQSEDRQEEDPEPVELFPVADPPIPGPGNPSPDGSTLTFLQEDANGETRLWFFAIDGSGGSSIGLPFIPVVDEHGPQWSPDGKQIALVGQYDVDGPTSIWIAPEDGGDCVLLANHPAAVREPRWSPDGSMLAFTSRFDDRDTICIAPPDGNGPVVQMTFGHAGQNDHDPCWSEDSTRIGFLRSDSEGENSGDHVWIVSLASGETKQGSKKLANRRHLRWNPGKMQIAFITEEGESSNVAVVNPDNSAGWNLASESGDKDEPELSADGKRILYTRQAEGEVRLCERPTSGANPDLIDPGKGVVTSPRWLPDNHVVYRFAPSTGAPRFIVQEAKPDAERTTLMSPVPWRAGRPLIEPTYVEFDTYSGLKLGGLLYRDPEWKVPIPGVVYLADEPWVRNDQSFQPAEQALAAAGFAVFVPTLAGTPGLGRKIVNAIDDKSAESEMSDIDDAITMLRDLEKVDGKHVAVMGEGYGGALAILHAGSRPGGAEAVVAIDPIVDWDDEFAHGSPAWRTWAVKHFGLPATDRGRHALRTPTTYAGVIDAPLFLLATERSPEGRAAQLELLTGALTELEVDHTLERTESSSPWESAELAAAFIREVIGENEKAPTGTMRTDEV